jgi:hypothetical protein
VFLSNASHLFLPPSTSASPSPTSCHPAASIFNQHCRSPAPRPPASSPETTVASNLPPPLVSPPPSSPLLAPAPPSSSGFGGSPPLHPPPPPSIALIRLCQGAHHASPTPPSAPISDGSRCRIWHPPLPPHANPVSSHRRKVR